MGHGNNDPLGAGHKIHGTAHAGNHLSRNGPVSQPPSFIDLQATENSNVQVPAADQAEGDTTVQAASAGTGADRPASSVGQIRIFHADLGQSLHPNDAVLGLEELPRRWLADN